MRASTNRRRRPNRRANQRWIAAGLVLGGLAAAGCTVGPRYQKPSAPVPATFKELPPGTSPEAAAFRPARPQDDTLRGKWWEAFGDPQLNALEEQVAVSNQTLAQAEAQFRGARAAVLAARSNLFPTVTGSAGVTRSHTSQNRGSSLVPGGTTTGGTVATTGVTGGDTTIYQIPIDLSYEIDLFGRLRRQVEEEVETAQATAADVETTRLMLQTELAVDYFELRGVDQQSQLLNAAISAYDRALQVNKNRHDQGIVSGIDVAQAETQLETTRAQATDLRVSRTQLEHAIAILIGKPPAELTLQVAPIGVQPPAIPVALPSELLERRPDIAAAERRVAAANAQIGVAEAAYFPSLTLSASAGLQSTTLGKLFSVASRFWSVGPSLAATLFDGGLRRAQTEQARASYDAAVAAYREDVLTAFQNVEDNLSALVVLAQEAREQQVAIDAAERALTLAQSRYQGGITTYLEIVTAQAAALNNERTAVDILTRRMTASVNLVKALGGGWNASQLPSAAAVAAR